MGRSSQNGAATSNSMYERDRLRRMAQKLGLRLIKSAGCRAKPQPEATPEPAPLESAANAPVVAFTINERAS